MFSNEHNGHRDRGAAAVEMAIVLPLLLFVLFGLIDFGRAYNAQIQLSAAAREGVRLATLNPGATLAAKQADADYGDTAIKNRVHAAASGVPNFTVVNVVTVPTSCPVTANSVCIVYCPTSPSASDNGTVVVTSGFSWITGIKGMSKFFGTGIFPTPTTVQATGVMRCTG